MNDPWCDNSGYPDTLTVTILGDMGSCGDYSVHSNLLKADILGTKHSCPLTGGVRLQEVEKHKHHGG